MHNTPPGGTGTAGQRPGLLSFVGQIMTNLQLFFSESLFLVGCCCYLLLLCRLISSHLAPGGPRGSRTSRAETAAAAGSAAATKASMLAAEPRWGPWPWSQRWLKIGGQRLLEVPPGILTDDGTSGFAHDLEFLKMVIGPLNQRFLHTAIAWGLACCFFIDTLLTHLSSIFKAFQTSILAFTLDAVVWSPAKRVRSKQKRLARIFPSKLRPEINQLRSGRRQADSLAWVSRHAKWILTCTLW